MTLVAVKSIAIVLTFTMPVLTLLSFRGWAKHVRKGLPRWRNVLGLVSISIASLNSLVLLISFVLALVGYKFGRIGEVWLVLFYSAPIGTALGLSLRGFPRPQIILAGVLTITLLFTIAEF
jgi:hypothetical protein